MMAKGFKEPPGFPGYLVNRNGDVLSKDGTLNRTKGRQLFLMIAKKYIATTRASLVLRTFKRLPTPGECALHKDDNQKNNKIRNLYWGTRSQNHKDAVRNGKLGKGSIQASKMKKAWKQGRYGHVVALRRQRYGKNYFSKSNSAGIKRAWKNGKYRYIDWSALHKKIWSKRR